MFTAVTEQHHKNKITLSTHISSCIEQLSSSTKFDETLDQLNYLHFINVSAVSNSSTPDRFAITISIPSLGTPRICSA